MRIFLLLSLILTLTACDDVVKKVDHQKSVYKSVMESGIIRCGWADYPPYFIRSTDGKFSGLVPDMMQEISARTSLKIDYMKEVGWGSVITDITERKIDMGCSYFWANAARARMVDFTEPFVYDKLWVYQKADDNRVFTDYTQLNGEQYMFGTIDGSAENKVIDVRFSKAKKTSLPEITPFGELIESLATGKLDFIIIENNTAANYMTTNPNRIKRLELPNSVHVFPGVMLLPPNDPQFKAMIDAALREIDLDGTLDTILKKYGMQDRVGRIVYYK